MNQFLKRIAAVVLCVMLLVSSAMASTYTGKLIPSSTSNGSESLGVTLITPDCDPQNPTFTNSINSILSNPNLSAGQVGAAKNVDAVDGGKDGIVKIDLDAAYKPETVDVAFVLDRSGSMNMWVETIDAQGYSYTATSYEGDNRNMHVSPHNVPCMNPNHYYQINYMIEGSTTIYTYDFFPTSAETGKTTSWLAELRNDDNPYTTEHAHMSRLEEQIEDDIKEENGNRPEIIITSIGDHMAKGADNQPDKKINPDYLEYPPDGIGFSSPDADLENGFKDKNGCYDRSMLARHMIWQFVENIHEADGNNRIAYTAFANTADPAYKVGFTSDIGESSALREAILGDRGGAQFTNYTAGLNSAKEFFETTAQSDSLQEKTGGKKVLIFVSDGEPSPDSTATDGGKGVQVAQELRNMGVEIYAVGVNIGNDDALKAISSGDDHAQDCTTAEEFVSFLSGIMDVVLEREVTITDTLGANYTLKVGPNYPFEIFYEGDENNEKNVTITIDSEKNKVELQNALSENGISYEGQKITTTVKTGKPGVRVSFYAQLSADKRNPSVVGSEDYITNDPDMTYTVGTETKQVKVDDKLIVKHIILTATKSSDKAGNKVYPGEIIPYTITVTNSDAFDLTDLTVTDVIPEGTEFKQFTNDTAGSLDGGTIKFTPVNIPAGGTVSFSFEVKVLPGINTIVNKANFTVKEAVTPDPDDSTKTIQLIAQTNEVVNPRGDVPQVKAVKSNGEMEDKAVKPGDVIPYTITLTNENEFALTNVKVTDVIPEGTEYVQGSGGTYNAEKKQVEFTADKVEAKGSISFTFKVKVLVGMNTIVNQASYSVAEIVEEDPKNPGALIPEIFETNRVENPRGDVEISAVKSNGSMVDKAVKPGDLIPYTITLINNNNVALTDVLVVDPIPEGTEYVKGSGGTYDADNDLVVFTAESIAPNSNITFTFYVKVFEGTNVIVNKAYYSVAEIVVPNSDPDYPNEFVRVTFETNEVDNPRMVFTEEIPNVPQTGDNASPLVWALLALLSLACITMMMNRKKA